MTAFTPNGARPLISSRINPRLVTVAAVSAVLIGYPASAMVRNHLNGGIEKTASGYKVDWL